MQKGLKELQILKVRDVASFGQLLGGGAVEGRKGTAVIWEDPRAWQYDGALEADMLYRGKPSYHNSTSSIGW